MNIFFVSMGCAKNTVDSERLMGRLVSAGHRIINDLDELDRDRKQQKQNVIGIINTCGFIQDAVKENIDAILDLERLKEDGKISHIVVAGCLVNRYEAELRVELPTVDLFARAEDWDSVMNWISTLNVASAGSITNMNMTCAGRFLMPNTGSWSRILKISEGCDTFCSYCAIPSIRGRLRSTPVEALVKEAVALCESGAKELCLVGQDLTVYGRDLYGEPVLERLVAELDRSVPDGTWLRLFYLHPDRMTEKLADFILSCKHVLHYLDVPIQHVNSEILTKMHRAASGERIKKIIRHIREADPLFAIRTTIMTGFPGETDEQFEEVLEFLEEMKLDRVGAFVYSPEEGTSAASLPNPVPREIAEERWSRLMELQSEIAQERSDLFIGRELDVLVEGSTLDLDSELEEFENGSSGNIYDVGGESDGDAEGGGELWGRSYRDAPEVDGEVNISISALGPDNTSTNLSPVPGSIVRVRIDDCMENDLFGTLL